MSKRANDSRRAFLKGSALGLSALWARPAFSWVSSRRVPMLQSWTEGDTAVLAVLGEAGWRFQITQGSGAVVQAQSVALGDRVLWHLLIRGLSTSLYSRLTVLDETGRARDERHLKGLDPQLAQPRIALLSCSNYRNLENQTAMWRQIPAARADLIFFVGDIVYANSKWNSVVRTAEEPATAVSRYLETWEKLDLYALNPLVPVMATWDDHDYGMNNGDASHPYRQNMWNIFRSFYPLPASSPRLLPGPGVSFRWSMFGLDLYALDGRSFRVAGRTQWGAEQEAWFARDYTARAMPALIGNGTSFLAYNRFIESVQGGGGSSFERLRKLVRETKRPAVFLSGDVHASQVQTIPQEVFGFPTSEITSSAVHSSSAGRLHHRGPSAGQVFYEGGSNFICFSPTRISSQSIELNSVCATPGGFLQAPSLMTRC
jgi:phosphodiesterase/alkaline phosphatase D-like protein